MVEIMSYLLFTHLKLLPLRGVDFLRLLQNNKHATFG